jgi:hypothetical protein
MTGPDFVKGECRLCGGHLEFPADAVGETIVCPHCGRLTMLDAPILATKAGGHRRIWPGIVVVVCLVAAGLAAVSLVLRKANRAGVSGALPLPAAETNAPAVTAPVAPPKTRIAELTNDFAILPFKLENTPGSSLVYVTGTVQNQSNRQRFGVKVEFSLFDTNDNPIGTATDYQQMLDPHGQWRFKALVMQTKAASVRFGAILEDQ